MPPSIHVYGVDTSVFVRLLTGHPEKAFRTTVAALEKLHQMESTAGLVVSNQVIGEAYITLQHHYGISKGDARAAILQLFDSGAITPLGGPGVRQILKTSGGAGLLDRLIANDYESRGAKVLTNDKRMAKIPGVELLG